MEQTELNKLKSSRDRFVDEWNTLKSSLDDLTTDGAGVLFELKQAVGENNLDGSVAKLGEKVMLFKERCISSYEAIIAKMDEKIALAESALNTAAGDVGLTAETIDASINF